MCSEKQKQTPIKAKINGPQIVRIEQAEVTAKPLSKKERFALKQKMADYYKPRVVSDDKPRFVPEIDSETPLTYNNKKSQEVEVEVTSHVRHRFMHRWREAMPHLPDKGKLHSVLADWFNSSVLFNATGRRYDARRKRHGKDTVYFKKDPFVFIVQSARLLTVELGTKDKRHLNKYWEKKKAKRSVETKPIKEITCSVFAWIDSPTYGDHYVPCGNIEIKTLNEFRTNQTVIGQVQQLAIEKSGFESEERGGGYKFEDASIMKIYAAQTNTPGIKQPQIEGVHFIVVEYSRI